MNGFDWILLAIIAVSGLIGVWRGFVREAISLTTWILAFWIALMFAPNLAAILPAGIESPTARWVGSAIALFMATLLAGGLANYLVSSLVDRTGLTGTDRSLGVVFGVLRGVAVIALCVLVMERTALVDERWWQESTFLPVFAPAAAWMGENIPGNLTGSLISESTGMAERTDPGG